MKLLKIDSDNGYFLADKDRYEVIDKITKEHLLNLVNLTLNDDVEFDKYDANLLKNHAHQVIYKSVYEKLFNLEKRKKEFKDASERAFLTEYEKYQSDLMKDLL